VHFFEAFSTLKHFRRGPSVTRGERYFVEVSGDVLLYLATSARRTGLLRFLGGEEDGVGRVKPYACYRYFRREHFEAGESCEVDGI